jgi:hypothetical protein
MKIQLILLAVLFCLHLASSTFSKRRRLGLRPRSFYSRVPSKYYSSRGWSHGSARPYGSWGYSAPTVGRGKREAEPFLHHFLHSLHHGGHHHGGHHHGGYYHHG